MNGSMSNSMVSPSGRVIRCVSRSTERRALPPFSASSISLSTVSWGSAINSMPFFEALLLKMSAKLGAMTQRMPKSTSAQGACSRDEPQPKFSPATRILASR